jgi:Arc/MetJ family transcription regulator
MPRIVVEIDDDLLAAAARQLGTTTEKDTVEAAVRQAAWLTTRFSVGDRFRVASSEQADREARERAPWGDEPPGRGAHAGSGAVGEEPAPGPADEGHGSLLGGLVGLAVESVRSSAERNRQNWEKERARQEQRRAEQRRQDEEELLRLQLKQAQREERERRRRWLGL